MNNEKHAGGRPRIFESPEEMQVKIDEYFKKMKKTGDIPLVAELALEIGLSCTQSLRDYQARKEFSFIVKGAKEKCGFILNKMALRNEVNAKIAGLNLSANHNLNEKQEIIERKIDLTGEMTDEQLQAEILKLESN